MVLVLLAIIHAKNWNTISKATEKEEKHLQQGFPQKTELITQLCFWKQVHFMNSLFLQEKNTWKENCKRD